MKKVAIMARVSSDEQAKGSSLDNQDERLRKYCERNNVEIEYAFKEDFSAKTFNRPEYKKFLLWLKANKGKIDHLLFITWDRFSRNTEEAYGMISKLRSYGVQAQAIDQFIDFRIPENKAMLAFYLALPEIDNDRRAIRIKDGIRGHWKKGRWTHKAPHGYKNSRGEDNKPLLITNEDSKHIAYIFEEVAKERSHADIRLELRRKGFNVTKSTFGNIIRNPLYIAKIFVPAFEDEPGYMQQAIHEPIISDELFYKVQSVLNHDKVIKNRPGYTQRRKELPLRGILTCSKCNSHLTGSPSRSRNGHQHFYYHCNHCKQERFRADDANETVEQVLEDIKLVQEYHEVLKQNLNILFNTNDSSRDERIKSLREEISKQEKRIDSIEDMLADGQLTHAEFSSMRGKYSLKLAELQMQLSEIKDSNQDLEKQIETGLQRIANLSKLYTDMDLDGKIRLLGSIFPERLQFDGEKCRTSRVNELILLGMACRKGFDKIKTGQITHKLMLSSLVGQPGIEPGTY
jgi:site-specific DNA recombinase